MISEENDTQNEQPEAGEPDAAEQPEAADQPEAAPQAEPEAEQQEAAEQPSDAPDAPAEQLSPKERRRRARSTHRGEPRPQRSPAERAAERGEARRQKAAARRTWRARQRETRRAEGAVGPATTPPVAQPAGGRARERQGLVVSDKAAKTITVRIDVARQHRMYKKIVRTSSTLHAHDERNEANAGDTVRVIESRPLSRSKRWRLVEILERAR
jgi:small subunit ribosomal protein S17